MKDHQKYKVQEDEGLQSDPRTKPLFTGQEENMEPARETEMEGETRADGRTYWTRQNGSLGWDGTNLQIRREADENED